MSIARFLISTFLAGAIVLGVGVVSAQNYPNRPVRILSTDPGGLFDIIARLIAQEISDPLGQPVIVENRPATLTPQILARATPDGYTVSLAGGGTWITPLIQKMPYDPVKDFSAVTLVQTSPYALVVNASVPVKTVRELIDLAKAKPGVLNIAAGATPGGGSFLASELFKVMAGVNLVRVLYKGNATALIAVLAGESQLMFNDITGVASNIKSGKLRALGVTSLDPSPLAPGLPTLAASGLPGYEVVSTAGILAPAGTPAASINRLNQEIVRAINRADVKEKFFNYGAQVVGSSPTQFAAKIKSEMAKWSKILKDAGIRAES